IENGNVITLAVHHKNMPRRIFIDNSVRMIADGDSLKRIQGDRVEHENGIRLAATDKSFCFTFSNRDAMDAFGMANVAEHRIALQVIDDDFLAVSDIQFAASGVDGEIIPATFAAEHGSAYEVIVGRIGVAV